jgi:hypothetical protein
MGATVEVGQFTAALAAWGQRTRAATEAGVVKAGGELKAVIEGNLDRSHYPPASDPGTPPAYRSGFLHDNVYQRTRELAGGYQERVYPSTVYARIHELSGWAGAGHRSFLPKRPYVGPALDEYTPQFRGVMVEAWRTALPGG